MKLSLIFAITFPVLVATATQEADHGYPIEDHLVPVNFNADKDIRSTLHAKLALTPANYGRLIVEPPFDGESAVAVYSTKRGIGQNKFHVTLVRAADNLSHAVLAAHIGRKLAPIAIKRIDADVPESTAVAIGKVWKAMLSRVRNYNYRDEIRPPLDYVEFEFSLDQPDGKTLYGEAPYRGGKPADQPLTSKLIELGQALVSYCEADAPKRLAMATRIEADANKLNQTLTLP